MTEKQITDALESLRKAKKQLALFEFFLSETVYNPERKTNIGKKQLLQKSNTEEGTLRSLVARKILRIEEIEIGRLDFSHDQETMIFDCGMRLRKKHLIRLNSLIGPNQFYYMASRQAARPKFTSN
ncbi:MAG: hypothetical protein AB2L20_13765 [Mangrovibacterium sp.]